MNPIKYETALLLREKMLSHNFSIYGEYAYCLNTNELVRYIQNNTFAVANKNIFYPDNDKHYFIPAPFQEEVIEWLWNDHKILVYAPLRMPKYNCDEIHFIIITQKTKDDNIISYKEYDNIFFDRNEAMEQGIIEALKLIKNK